MSELARSAGAEIVADLFQVRPDPDAATLFGQGKVREIRETVEAANADVVIVDNDLSPTQQRNLEKALECKVIDRTQLILDIFARRARTAEGRLQVELAQLKYRLPRLTGHGVALSRLGGGIGTRGPGETKLETDRRRIQIRIARLEKEIEGVRRARALHRRKRDAVPVPTISLAGYTNAGKSTLFNRLTAAGVLADARMFATLDPTVRALVLPSRRKILLSDTVGFIRNLPTTLIDAFRATLEEVADAELILHVVDVSSDQARAHVAEVFRVLGEIGASRTPQILVLNKCDRLSAAEADAGLIAPRLLSEFARETAIRSVLVSGLNGQGIADLLDAIDQALPFDPVETVWFRIPVQEAAAIAMLHRFGKVRRAQYDDNLCFIETEAPESLRRRLSPYVVPEGPAREESSRFQNSSTSVENSVHK